MIPTNDVHIYVNYYMKKFLSIVLLSLLFIACNKVNLQKEYSDVIGDYEWVFSENGATNFHAYDYEGDRYGIRVKEKRKVQFFKNGEKIEEYKISETEPLSEGVVLSIQTKYGSFRLRIDNGNIETTRFPFRDFNNHFEKIK